MIESLFLEISVVLVLATILAVVARIFRQNPILSYILTGVIVGPLGYLAFNSKDTLEVMSKIGITLLLFLVGLEMNLSGLKQIGKPAMIIGVGQVVFTALVGYYLSLFLGFAPIASIYISLALTFSSTIIVIKLLSEKKDLGSLYGRIVVGVLLVQDFIALLVLMFLAGLEKGAGFDAFNIATIFLKGGILLLLLIIVGKNILPKFIGFIARSQEILFLFSIAFAMGIASLFASHFIGLTLEIGGFLAGIALSYSSQHYQIHSRIRPLRDFFVIIFFIILGSTLVLKESADIFLPVLAFSSFVLIGNPLIVMVLMGILGYKKRTSFLAGLTVAQISEFSFVLMQLGSKIGQVDERTVAVITLVGIVTITVSSYFIIWGNGLYKIFSPALRIFERKKTIEKDFKQKDISGHIILVGAHRLGAHLLGVLPKETMVIVDFNPDIVKKLESEGYNVIYGDISDEEIQDSINILDAKLVVSTVPDITDSFSLIHRIRENSLVRKVPKIIVTAMEEWEAKSFYNHGADYVILPHYIGAQQIAQMIEADHEFVLFKEAKKRDLEMLAD